MQQLTLSQVSLQKQPSSITEMYIPLWVYSNSYMARNSATPGTGFVAKGTGSPVSAGSNANLHTLNANWPVTQKFAFEASMFSDSGYTAYAELWDMTSNAPVSSSQISTASTTYTLIRSGQFTLTPGHTYGITLWSSNSAHTAYLTKAHLVAFLS